MSEKIYNGQRAKDVLENEMFKWAMNLVREEVKVQWESSPARDQEGREKLWVMLQMCNKLEATLQTILETGKLEELELSRKRSMLERLKDEMYPS